MSWLGWRRDFDPFVLLLALGLSAQCAELVLDPVTAQAGSTVPIAVRFVAAGAQVTALQFDMNYDPLMVFGASAASAATSASKGVYLAAMATGHSRLLLAGMNQQALGDGPVVALAAFVTSSTPAGAYALQLTNLAASDQNGNSVPLTSSGGSVTVTGSASIAPSGIFAQVAAGAGWTTSLTLLNVTASPAGANLTFWKDDGTTLALPLTFSPELAILPTTSSAVDVLVPANGVLIVKTDLPAGSEALKGWARLTAQTGVVGSANFLYTSTDGSNLEAVAPLETRTPSSFVLPFDNTSGLSTGVAVANGSDTLAATIQVTARDASGTALLLEEIPLPVNGHTSFMLATQYPSLAGVLGSIEFHNVSGGSISVLGLRMNQSGSLTSVPAEAK